MPTSDLNAKGFPRVKRLLAYRPGGAEPGHDDEPPIFVEARDIESKGKREKIDALENVNCSRIAYLYARGRIEWRQFMAAERLWRDAYEMGKFPRASNIIVGNGGSGVQIGPGDMQVNASRRYHDARRDLEYARNWAIVELVVEDQISVEKAAGLLRVHHQYAQACLHNALHILANHYRFA
jgi:hypothetical protein